VSGKGRARIFLFARIRKSGYFCPVVFLYVQEATRLVAISGGDLRSFQIWFFWGLFRPFRCLWIGLFYCCNSLDFEGIKTVLSGRFLLKKKICIKKYC